MAKAVRNRRSGRYGGTLRAITALAIRAAKSGSRTRSRGSSGSGAEAVSTQFDQKVMYRKRRPRGSKRKQRFRRRQRKRVIYDTMALQGCNQFMLKTEQSVSTVVNQQATTACCMLGSGTAPPNNDLNSVRTNLAVSGVAASFRLNARVFVKTQIMDVTIQATTANVTADVDVYLIRCRRPNIDNTTPDGSWDEGLIDQQKPDGTLGTTTRTVIGTTPFQAPIFCKYWTVLKKTKYLLSTGQTCHFQIKQTRPRFYQMEDAAEYYFAKGVMGIIIVWNGVYNGVSYPVSNLAITYNRVYNCKYIPGGSDDRLVSGL